MYKERAQWPHTIEDIKKSLDGVWGVVGATDQKGNLFRLERSLKEPTVYTLIEYVGEDEKEVKKKTKFESKDKDSAIDSFARAIGFEKSSFIELN